MARFLIRHPKTGEEYALDSVTDFRKKRGAAGVSYEKRGFVIPKNQPHGWKAPRIKANGDGDGDGENEPPTPDPDNESSNDDGEGETK